jgi:subtilisin family serine protease
VAVVNISLVGPADQVLQRIVERALAQGLLIVAAAGNDGPAAPPLYPASWPGVVGVGAVDGQLRLLPEGARGPQVMFVAPGADMAAAAAGTRAFAPVRGTSFAAPFVAGLLAANYQVASPEGAQAAIARLVATARDLPRAPRDGIGRGLVAETLRTPTDAVALAR